MCVCVFVCMSMCVCVCVRCVCVRCVYARATLCLLTEEIREVRIVSEGRHLCLANIQCFCQHPKGKERNTIDC